MRTVFATIIILVLAGLGCVAQTFAASVDQQFANWLQKDLWPAAKTQGISKATFNMAFSGVRPNLKLPDLIMPGSGKKVPTKQRQAEFRSPSAYFDRKYVEPVVAGGSKLLKKYGQTLKRIESRTGVPGRIMVAIWGRESAFGKAKIPYNAFEVLGTKAFMSTRKPFFTEQVLAALQMVEKHKIPASKMRGSWAGALGQPQFMPTSYIEHARDGDGNGGADIWGSVPDTLASIGGYLADKGWVKGRDWGFEVNLPKNISCTLEGPDQGRKISQWADAGIKQVNGKPFPAHERAKTGYLMLPAGRYGPAFIVTPNFFVIKEYNKSDLYALFVGHSGDRMQYGGKPFQGNWGKVGGMLRSDIAKMQRGLEKQGYDVGGADGLPGFKTRRSIGDWQQKNGLVADCFPTNKLLKRLR